LVSPITINTQDAATQLIRQAAQETGADFNFLVRTAARESNFDASAQASTSSASGMYQFIEQTWLGMVDRHGQKHGLSDMANAIIKDANGRYQVSDPEKRQSILDLRFDPAVSARMAGELASDNADIIEIRLGRRPSSGELYAAHFLGANGAAGLIAAAEQTPSRRADQLFPQAAEANRRIFYEGGQPRTVREVLAVLSEERPVASRAPAPSSPFTARSAPVQTRYTAPVTPGSMRIGEGELSPALMEILASLDVPRSERVREK